MIRLYPAAGRSAHLWINCRGPGARERPECVSLPGRSGPKPTAIRSGLAGTRAGVWVAAILALRVHAAPAPAPLRPHPDAVPNTHAPGEVDRPELVPFIVANPAALPGIVVDETAAVLRGAWQYSTHTPPYVGLGYLHDQRTGKGTKSVTFTPDLPHAGLYEVRIAHCYNVRRARNTPVMIHGADGETIVRISQQTEPPHDRLWRVIGTFRFAAGRAGWVRISNEGTDGGYVIADAVQFLPVPARSSAPDGSPAGVASPPQGRQP